MGGIGVSEALALVADSAPVAATRLEERAADLTTRTVEAVTESFAFDLALRCTDLTSLEPDDTKEKIVQMCARALRPDPTDPSIPSVAAVCIYSAFVPAAIGSLKGTAVKVAGVAGAFPNGDASTETKLREIREVVDAGADEVDMTLNRSLFLAGGLRDTYEEIAASKEICGTACLKVILETGELAAYDQIRKASLVVMAAGADFIKTSTGKFAPGATFTAALCIMEAIKDMQGELGRRVGIKVSGGIRKAEEARRYVMLLHEALGSEWLTPDLFRIGASSLLDDLVVHIRMERNTKARGRA